MMKRTSVAQNSAIPRRSSSADNFGASSQNRQSSIGAGRSSSIGRPSSVGIFKTADGKPVEAKDLAPAIFDELELLGFPITEQFTVKTLLLPSTGTFYSIFEFLIKTIGIQDVWNSNLLVQPNQPKNQPISSSQPNAVQQNKTRIELIIHHLTFLKFNNVPKPNILQNMTTPKHWTLMLQILYFLCNNCKFLNVFDAERVVTSMASNQEFICNYISKCYKNVVTKGYGYLRTDEYIENKKESLTKFEEILKGNYDYEKIMANLKNRQKNYEHLNTQRNEFDNLLKEEDELKRMVDEEEAAYNNEKLEYEDRLKRNVILKTECASLKERVNQMEREVAVKDAQYDRQLASGKQLGNLPAKHSQTLKDLENLQNLLVDFDNEKDELYIQLNQKSTDAKASINKANEILNKIKISSMLQVDEIPLLEIVDLHKKNNMKEYKELFSKVRQEFNEKICKLPNQLSQCLMEKKVIESKIESFNIKVKNLEQEVKNYEELLAELRTSTEVALLEVNQDISIKKNDLTEAKQQHEISLEKLAGAKDELKKILDEKKKVEAEASRHQIEMIENLERTKKERYHELELIQKQIRAELDTHQKPIADLITEIKDFLKNRPKMVDQN